MKKWKGRGKEKSVSKMLHLAHGFANHLIYLIFLMISSALSFSLSKLNTL